MNTHADNEHTTAPAAEPTPEEASTALISFDYFSKLDIRIGTILSVAIVEDADKLLQLSVDVGEDVPRQIVSGIRQYFSDPQELVGRQCQFLVNLKPRVIRGLESQGMILAASTTDQFALLSPHTPLPAGANIR